jgi:multisubunit Na+/H+ antiporter MnhE subunit
VIGFSDSVTITLTLAGLAVALALIVVLRLLLRREPTPARWRRYRLGIFVERDPTEEDDSSE